MDSLPTRETLLIKIRDSDDDIAWNEFVELYTPLIYRYLASRGLSESDIPDVTQDTLRSVAQAIEKFEYDPAKARFRSWLFKVTYSKLSNHFRKIKNQPRGTGSTAVHRLLDEQPSPEAENDWDLEYRRHVFHWASERVRPEFESKTWDAFYAVAVEHLPGQEVADRLGMSVGAIYTAKSRVIARLRESVQSLTGDGDVPKEIA